MLNKLVLTISKKFDLSKEEIVELLKESKADVNNIPVCVFVKDLSALEAIVKYLKEVQELRYSEIGEKLNRDQRTVWSTYHKAEKKHPRKFVIEDSGYFIPVNIFRERLYGVLEVLVHYLKEHYHLRYSEIGVILERNQRTVWTVYQRYKKKEVAHE